MMMLTLLWILAVPAINLLSAQASVYHDRVIHVHKKGNNSESCLTGQDMRQGTLNQYCQSMEFIANKLQNSQSRNVTIILESKIQVRSAINFSDHEVLTIQGRSKDTNLNCNCNNLKADSDSIGISFIHINYLKVYRLTITQCCGITNNYTASLYIQNCSGVIIEDSRIRSNKYSGLILVNPSGMVNIRKCNISDNGHIYGDISSTGAGLHIEFSQYSLATVVIEISDCEFTNNVSPGQKRNSNATVSPLDITEKRHWKRQSIGGGLAIALLSRTNATKINISNCTFMKNSATWGGGVCIYMQRGTYNNTVAVSNSTFVKNYAQWGGGGLQVRLGELSKKSQNYISFDRVIFEKNFSIIFGGGTSVSALLLSYVPSPGELLRFINCTWYKNRAWYSPAIDLSPYRFQQSRQGYSPIPLFEDIKIQSNFVSIKKTGHVLQGVFVITRFTAYFQSSIHFHDNWYTALYLTSGSLAVFANCSVQFFGNQGIRGGAIAIRSFSALVIRDSSNFIYIYQ